MHALFRLKLSKFDVGTAYLWFLIFLYVLLQSLIVNQLVYTRVINLALFLNHIDRCPEK